MISAFKAVILIFMTLASSAVYGQEIKFVEIGSDKYKGPTKAGVWPIANKEALDVFWGKNIGRNPPPPAPKVDFSKYLVFAVSMGAAGYGCDIKVDRVAREDNRCVVHISRICKKKSRFSPTVMTYSWIMFKIIKPGLPVYFLDDRGQPYPQSGQ